MDRLPTGSSCACARCLRMVVLARAIASWMDSPWRRMIDTDIVLGVWGFYLFFERLNVDGLLFFDNCSVRDLLCRTSAASCILARSTTMLKRSLLFIAYCV